MDIEILNKVLTGGAEKVIEAGCNLCGGHTIVDETVKYGLAVTGIVNTDKILKNNTVKAGDKIILTKPLGVGIILTAYKCDDASKDDYDKIINSMTTLNRYAAEILFKYDIHALTDVTGFGLFNHLHEMLSDNATAILHSANIPMISSNVEKYLKEDYYTGASGRNEDAIKDYIDYGDIPEFIKLVGFDPQTSGGLLCSIDAKDAEKALVELNKLELKSTIIGEVTEKRDKSIVFVD